MRISDWSSDVCSSDLVCAAPTRFYIQSGVYEAFMERFVALTTAITLGDGFDEATRMGPLSSARRVTAMNAFVHDAVDSGGSLIHGGAGGSGDGFFYQPTIVANLPGSAKVMRDQPFGPIAAVNRSHDIDQDRQSVGKGQRVSERLN